MVKTGFRSLLLGLALTLGATGMAAAQTAPGTVVSNTIDLTYQSGTGTPVITQDDVATVTFQVDRKIDVAVTAQAGSGQQAAVPGQDTVVLPFEVENLGNDTQGFDIDVVISAGGTLGLTYSATATTTLGQYYVVISADATLGSDTPYDTANPANAGDLAAGGSYFALIVANVPLSATDGLQDTFEVTATATTAGSATAVTEDRTQGLNGVNTVFADAASNSSLTSSEIDGAETGADKDETRLLVTAPIITATKTVGVLSENLPSAPFTCASDSATAVSTLAAIPGACLEYTITVTNDGGASTAATNIELQDVLPSGVTFAGVSSITYTGNGAGSATTTTEPANSGGTVTATIGTLPADTTATFTIRVTVD